MKKLIIVLLFIVSLKAYAEVPLYSKPTEFEFKVYKYTEERIWDLPLGKEAEDAFMVRVAKKFNISAQDASNIYMKFSWYESSLQGLKQNHRIGEMANMPWSEAKKWIDKIGAPK
jgi:hypothetical protein